MATSALSAKFFHDEAAAYIWLESVLWPEGPVCPHCGGFERITVVGGTTGRMGLKRCLQCKKQFTVTVGTVFERSHVKLHLWLQAAHLLCTSKKGMSSLQISRILGVTYRTAWFMTHVSELRWASPKSLRHGWRGQDASKPTRPMLAAVKKSKHVGKRNPKNIGGAGKAIVHIWSSRAPARALTISPTWRAGRPSALC